MNQSAHSRRRPVNTVALCGGLASGKSTIAGLLEHGGWSVLDTDALAADLRRDASIGRQIDHALGHRDTTTSIAADPARLRERLFRSPDDLRRVEAILHPLIRKRVAQTCRDHRGPEPLLVVVPLLFEAEWNEDFSCIVSVSADEETRIERALSRPGWTRETVAGILSAQTSDEKRNAAADWVIKNGRTVTHDELLAQVHDLQDTFRLCHGTLSRATTPIRSPRVAPGTMGQNPSDGSAARCDVSNPRDPATTGFGTFRDFA